MVDLTALAEAVPRAAKKEAPAKKETAKKETAAKEEAPAKTGRKAAAPAARPSRRKAK